MKKALMIIAMVAIVAIAGSLIYYFIFFRTEKERSEVKIQEQKLELEKQNLQQKKDIQTQESLDKALKEKKATEDSIAMKTSLAKCLDENEKAYSSQLLANYEVYSNAWNAECKRLNLPAGSPLPKNISDGLQKQLDDGYARITATYESKKSNCYKFFGE